MTAAVGSGKNATASNPASTAACSRRTRASACEAARLDGSEPAKTTGCPSTTRRAPSETAASASFFNRLSTTATSEPTVKSVAQELVPAKPTFARSCFTPDSSRASLQPPPLRYCRQSVSQPYGARAQFQQSVFSCPDLRNVFTASSPGATPAAMEIDERWQRHRGSGWPQRQLLDAVGIGHRDRAVARPEIDSESNRSRGRIHPGTIYRKGLAGG